MRRIRIESWKARVLKFDETGKVVPGKFDTAEENLLVAFNNLIAAKEPKDMPRGLDQFRLFNRLSKAFEKAEKTKILELEEVDYKFLKDTIERDIPSAWGMSINISKAIEEFLEAKQEEQNDSK